MTISKILVDILASFSLAFHDSIRYNIIMKKILAVCGDSYLTPSTVYPNTHFSELIADQLGYTLLVLSRSAMSNGGICIQIEEAIRRRADFIIIGFTTSERMEIPIPGNVEKYNKELGIENIDYSRYKTNVSFRPNTANTNLISNTISSLIEENNLSDEYAKALKYYLTYLYDPVWQKQKDIWMTNFLMRKVVDSRIPFLLFRDSHYNNYYYDDYAWIPEKNIAQWENSPQFYWQTMPGDASYHTTIGAQRLIAIPALNQINEILKQEE